MPDETKKIYELKGKLLEMIEDLIRVGNVAFDGDAVKRAHFNKDLLLRARRAARAAKAEAPAGEVRTTA